MALVEILSIGRTQDGHLEVIGGLATGLAADSLQDAAGAPGGVVEDAHTARLLVTCASTRLHQSGHMPVTTTVQIS